jgi:hypothetical protein
LHFTKTSFDKEDYNRISKTIGFRFDKAYLLEKAAEYFGVDLNALPASTTDPAIELIKRLNNNDIVDVDDITILSEAFEIMNQDAIYEYDMVEYDKQPWDEKPYKSVADEYAQYVDNKTIKVQYLPMKIETGSLVEGEVLTQLTPKMYRSQHENWISSSGIIVQKETDVTNVWETLSSGYSIDYLNGIVTLDETTTKRIRSSYSYSNISIVRKTYSNSKASRELLTKLQDKVYIPKNMSSKRIVRSPNPQLIVVDTDGQTKTLLPGSYSIDYKTGLVTTSESITGNLYMTYTYSNIEKIELKDYDTRHGLLELDRTIHFNDNVYASYVYKEECYEYKGYFDKNYVDPITNTKGKYIYLDVNPTRGHVCTYPTVKSGNVVYSEVPTYNLLGKTVYLYIVPHVITKGNQTIQEDVTIRHTFSLDELKLMQIAHPELIVIGSVKVINNYTVYDTETLDIRKRGGGIKDSISKEKVEAKGEVYLNLWDMSSFDGRSYYPNGITVIKLPKTILVENGESIQVTR